MTPEKILDDLGIGATNPGACAGPGDWSSIENRELLSVISPIDGLEVSKIALASEKDCDHVIKVAKENFENWRLVPAPKRGEVVREIADEFRKLKEPLSRLVTLEMGKIIQEGMGEVQEAIDIADFAVGLSRQLYGLSMHSERPSHSMYEQWHPLGVVGIISAFNFPIAVWSWNSMIASVCGDTTGW